MRLIIDLVKGHRVWLVGESQMLKENPMYHVTC